MNLGQRLFELRKAKNLSQEEVADKLNVTRQTVSKWETDQSTPDFDKIAPLCELYNITADQLVNDIKEEKKSITTDMKDVKVKKARGICIGIFLYFVAVAWIMTAIPLEITDAILGTAIFLLICGLATGVMIYTCMVYKTHEKEEKEKKEENIVVKQINSIISIVILVIYLVISFTTMAWHITWILWVVCGLLQEIVKLIFTLKDGKNEK
ncbi:MAG TPA: helix-turn-helix transcriptional regulator [Bacilli bacterium]|mgnify:CR=1 FL=1|nr:helix-turn-helix transcriptional regulator [Bacilli bacterium]